MLSKAEMEKAWQSGPIGFLKNHCTKTKGQKLYKIRITPYKQVDIEEHVKTYEVWSKKRDDAVWDAKNMWYREHYDVNQTGIRVTHENP